MIILGLPSIHTPTWTLLSDGVPIASIEEERLHRDKGRFGFLDANDHVNVTLGLEYVLETAGVSLRDVHAAAFGFNPNAIRAPRDADLRLETVAQERIFNHQALLLRYLRRRGLKSPVYYVRHHLAHAASTYFVSPFDEAAVVSIDGWGEDDTVTVWRARQRHIECVGRVGMPHSIGEAYTHLTLRLGWGMDDAGKTMALAAYGEPAPIFSRLFRFENWNTESLLIDTSLAIQYIGSVSVRAPDAAITDEHIAAAATLQAALEHVLMRVVNWAHEATGQAALCLTGGVALNCVANYKVLSQSPFNALFMQPACGDSGIALGAALAVGHHLCPHMQRYVMKAPFFGRPYDDSRLSAAAAHHSPARLDALRLCDQVARMIAGGKTVGWFQAGSEFGPRALGNRSILADPRRRDIQDHLNRLVKRRETFRPFAPSILRDRAGEFFAMNTESPFMLLACPVQTNKRNHIPGVIHVDGTARVQTVTPEQNALYYQLLIAFERETGVPLIVNTSFNIAGEPMVETPEDAVRCYENSSLDALALGSLLLAKEGAFTPTENQL